VDVCSSWQTQAGAWALSGVPGADTEQPKILQKDALKKALPWCTNPRGGSRLLSEDSLLLALLLPEDASFSGNPRHRPAKAHRAAPAVRPWDAGQQQASAKK